MRLGHHFIKELLAQPVLQQPLAVLGEHRRVEAGLHEVHVQKPPEEEVVIQLLAEGPLTADRVEGNQEGRLEEPLRGNGGPAHLGVHLVELGGERLQGLVGHGFDGP